MKSRFRNNRWELKCILTLFVVSTIIACDKQTIYHTFQPIPNGEWQQKDTLFFNVEVPDSFTYYKLFIGLRNNHKYSYQNINLSISCDIPGSNPLPADTLQFTLADKEGRWKGNGWGGIYQSEFFAGTVGIAKPGTYRFKIAYTLPDKMLQGINDVGIKLKK